MKMISLDYECPVIPPGLLGLTRDARPPRDFRSRSVANVSADTQPMRRVRTLPRPIQIGRREPDRDRQVAGSMTSHQDAS